MHDLSEKIKSLPEQPGVYRFSDNSGEIIYVGKAKNLRKRVTSYFNKSYSSYKNKKLVTSISDIDFSITESEFDAFLLENNLIKEYKPRYNILLKDDKSYPFLCLTNERFPRLIPTRRRYKNGGEYFGPYSSVKAMKNIMELTRETHHLRTCKLNLSRKNIEAGKFRVCLEYHIGKCLGPCEAKQGEEDYMAEIAEVRDVLKGRLTGLKNKLLERMNQASEDLEFEKAAKLKRKINLFDKFQTSTYVTNNKTRDAEVYALIKNEKNTCLSFLKIVEGSVINTKTQLVSNKKYDIGEEELISHFVQNIRAEINEPAEIIISNKQILYPPENAVVSIPQRGEKNKLLEIAIKNGFYHLTQNTKESEDYETNQLLLSMKEEFSLKNIPHTLECFDNSNLLGSNPVASMVSFKNGKPNKNEYRKFQIKTVTGPDDFASMKEIVSRRYSRLINEEKQLPDLILIDGGKGQLSAAVEALEELKILDQIDILGIAKRLEELYRPYESYPLHINKRSPGLRILQFARNEAHRFAITYHRQKRSKSAIHSPLEKLEGIGKITTDKILKKYRTIKRIKDLSNDELRKELGNAKASIIIEAIKKGNL